MNRLSTTLPRNRGSVPGKRKSFVLPVLSGTGLEQPNFLFNEQEGLYVWVKSVRV